jgi:hypothetical protein
MTDDDLIRRGDVLPALRAAWTGDKTFNEAVDALPAVQPAPDVAALVDALREIVETSNYTRADWMRETARAALAAWDGRT